MILHIWDDWRCLITDIRPVYVLEIGVFHDISEAVYTMAEAFSGIWLQKLFNQILRKNMNLILPISNLQLLPGNIADFDILEDFLNSVLIKRGNSDQELEKNDPHTPPVHFFCDSLPKQDLWGDVVRGPDDMDHGFGFVLVFFWG